MIKIDKTHFITADSNCFYLQEKRISQEGESKGKEYYAILGYYPTIDGALKGLLKKEIKKYISKETEDSLKEAIQEIDKIEKRITTVSKGF